MRRISGIVFCLLCGFSASAQTFIIPYIADNGNSLKELTPNGWAIIRQAEGYLNGDTLKDVAVVMEYKLPLSKNNPGSRPRILVVITGQTGVNKYHVAAQNSDIMLKEGESESESILDPLKTFEIRKDTLVIGFNGGSERAWTIEYKFKYAKEKWPLIQANYSLQVSGEATVQFWNFNFLKRTAYQNKYSLYDANHTLVTKKKHLKKGKTLEDMGRPFTWEVLPGVLI
jgi:hypothetical protein